MKKIIVCALICIFSICLFACNKVDKDDKAPRLPSVDYSAVNNFTVVQTDTEETLEFAPDGVKCSYGVVFYVGTAITPINYAYLGNALAKQGYLVVMPKRPLNMTYFQYAEEETAFSKYPDVKFFVAGHSQGGGAAVKRAQENVDTISGIFLLAPLTYGDTIANTNIPTLLINADNDHVLTDQMKSDAKSTLPENRTELLLENACHMSFSEFDDDSVLSFFGGDGPMTDEFRIAQRQNTVSAVLDFLRTTISA